MVEEGSDLMSNHIFDLIMDCYERGEFKLD